MRCRELDIFKILGIFGEFLIILEKFWEFFGNSLGILWKVYLNMEGINFFVKVLVFVKILSQWRRKEVHEI